MINCRCGLDCSDEAQARRRHWLAELEDRYFGGGGVTAVSERGRSVSFGSGEDLIPMINRLRRELCACETGRWPRRGDLHVIDFNKGL